MDGWIMDNGMPSFSDMCNADGYKNQRDDLERTVKDYEIIIGMISKALDDLVHACEDNPHSFARVEKSCAKAKELLPFYQPKED